MAINFNKAEFILSATVPAQFVHDGLPQVAFAGRSNVGKSSVINRVVNRKNFARVGASPGKTTQINYFKIDGRLYLVDLPGYGYAKVSKAERDRWGRLMENYFRSAGLIDLGVLIVDARHKPTADDVTMREWFRGSGCPMVVVANKLDKLKRSEIEPNLALIRETIDLGPPRRARARTRLSPPLPGISNDKRKVFPRRRRGDLLNLKKGSCMERKNYRIIALDMDGTLLTSDKTIAPDTVRDIRAASEHGIHVVYCTGRAVPELKLYFDMVPMMRYAVCSTGALVYDRVEKHCIDRRPVKSEMAAALAETAKRYRAMPHILTDDETIVAADDVTHMKDFHAGIYQPMFERITRKVADMAEEARHLTSIGKVNIYFRSSEDCHACYEELRILPLSFAMPEETTLEMTAQGVTKGSGLKALADYLHIPMEQTVGIGDSDNDRAMLHDAGLSVAMGNAQADIKAQCDLITEDNDHNGVGEAIRRILEL